MAIRMHAKHQALFAQLTTRFPPDVISKWEATVKAWEANPSKRNPYEEPHAGVLSHCIHSSS
jgi:hypothetical protein